MSKKSRLDQLVVQCGMATSREQARRLILAGKVSVADVVITKAGQLVDEAAIVQLLEPEHGFVGRGGMKLAHALAHFQIAVKNKICLDAGASTGGFTDCLLQGGARKVYAVDVGYGQLAWALRNDSRVVVMERTNLRHVTTSKIPERIEIVTLDLAFISLTKIFPMLPPLLVPNAIIIALIKPQFEVGKGHVGKGGIVRDDAARKSAIDQVLAAAASLQWQHLGVIDSPITGADGNVEFLAAFSVGL